MSITFEGLKAIAPDYAEALTRPHGETLEQALARLVQFAREIRKDERERLKALGPVLRELIEASEAKP